MRLNRQHLQQADRRCYKENATETAGGSMTTLATTESANPVILPGQALTSAGEVVARGVTCNNDSYYVCGSFKGTASWASGHESKAVGTQDAFLIRYDASGAVVWKVTVGTTGRSNLLFDVQLDPTTGDVFVVGQAHGNVLGFGDLAMPQAFVARYAATSGALVWVKKVTSSGQGLGNEIAIAGGNVYVANNVEGSGGYGDTGTTDPFTGKAGVQRSHLAAYRSADGTYLWRFVVPNSFAGTDSGRGLAASANGVALTGAIQTASDQQKLFLYLFSAAGRQLFGYQFESAAATTVTGRGCAIGGDGIYLTGKINGTVTLNSRVTLTGSNDLFVLKFSLTGAYVWQEVIAASHTIEGAEIEIDGENAIYIAGEWVGRLTVGGHAIDSTGNYDLFLLKLARDKAVQWLVVNSTGGGNEINYGITLRPNASALFTCGTFAAASVVIGERNLPYAGTNGALNAYISQVDLPQQMTMGTTTSVTSVFPLAGGAGNTFTVTGSGLASVNRVTIGTSSLHFKATSDSQLTVTLGTTLLPKANVSVKVTSSSGSATYPDSGHGFVFLDASKYRALSTYLAGVALERGVRIRQCPDSGLGNVLYEAYPSGYSKDTIHPAASFTKTVTAFALVLRAIQLGYIPDWHVPIKSEIPEWTGNSHRDSLTIYHCLTQTSGFGNVTGFSAGQQCAFGLAAATSPGPEILFTPAGSSWQYGPANAQILGEFFTRLFRRLGLYGPDGATIPPGNTYSATTASGSGRVMRFMYQQFLLKLGMTDGWNWNCAFTADRTPCCDPDLAGGLRISIEQAEKLGRCLLRGGVADSGEQVLSKTLIDAALEPVDQNSAYGIASIWRGYGEGPVNTPPSLDYPQLPLPVIYAGGTGGQRMYLDRSRGLIITHFCQVSPSSGFKDDDFLKTLYGS